MPIRSWCLAGLVSFTATSAFAAEPAAAPVMPDEAAQIERVEAPTPEQIAAAIAEFDKTLSYQDGLVTVADGKAALNVPPTFRYLGAADAQRVLEGPWGNPPDDSVLGMLVPAGISPIDPDRGWAVVITYEDSGHVDDADAAGIDYDELFTTMRTAQSEGNKQRSEQGFPGVELRGWAEPPHYDATSRKLYWAMLANFGGDPEDTLNYAIRVLGREGVLALNAVAPISQLAEIKPAMEQVVTFASFTQGNTYADYDEDTDKLATYGVGGLIAGGLIASKTGLLKGLWLALLAGKKFIVIGLVALGVLLKRMFSRKDKA